MPKALVELGGMSLARRSVLAMRAGGVGHVVVTTPTGLVRGRAIDVRPGLVLRDAVGGPAGEGGVGELVISAGDVASARLGTPTGT